MSGARAWLVALVAAAASLAAPGAARAHQPSQSFVQLDTASAQDGDGVAVTARWDVALRDLDRALTLDADGDGALSWREVTAREPAVLDWAARGLTLATSGPCDAARPTLAGTTARLDGAYLVLDVAATCPPLDARGVTVSERALFPMDPSHRAMVRLGGASAVLRADEPVAALPIADEPAVDTLATYVGEGVLHIWEGIDHIFFLLALLLPAVLWWRPRAAP